METLKMCRACLSTQSEMLRMDSDCLQNYNLLTNLKIDLDNSDLPQCMCRTCWDTVEAFIDFRNKCITTEASLNLIFHNEETEDKKGMKLEQEKTDAQDNVIIKLEVEDDDYLNFDEDLMTNEIKYEEILEDEITTEKKETKRKRGRPRKNVANITQAEKELLDFSLPVKKETRRKIGRPRKCNADPAHIHTEKQLSDFLPCGLCKNVYEDRDSLHNHLEKHRKGSVCYICNKEFRPWPQLLAHRINHLDDRKRRCHICFKMFRVDFYLEYHYLTKHYDEEFTGIKCKFCDKTAGTARKMKNHIWALHNKKKYICDYCGKEWPNKANLLSHILKHTNQNNYFCDRCSFSCKRISSLKAHILRKHTAVKHYCKVCSQVYSNQIRLDRHTCKGGVCPVCGKEFLKQKSRHKLNVHADVKYKCKVCHYGFRDELRLQKHACHTYVICEECGKRMRSSELSRHIVSHSDVRKYKCKICPNTFKSSSAMRLHEMKHENIRPHKCEYCSMRFFTNAVRIKHQRVHTGEKPYVCKICSKAFTGNHNLKVHMKVHGLDLVVKRGSEKHPTQQIFPGDLV